MHAMKKAFTLVEIILVVIIIGILAAVVMIGVAQVRAKARDSRRVADINLVAQKLPEYMFENKIYPADCDETSCAEPEDFILFENSNLTSIPEINAIISTLQQNAGDQRYYYMCKRSESTPAGPTIATGTVTARPLAEIEPAYFQSFGCVNRPDCINDKVDVDNTYLLFPAQGDCTRNEATKYTVQLDEDQNIPFGPSTTVTITGARIYWRSKDNNSPDYNPVAVVHIWLKDTSFYTPVNGVTLVWQQFSKVHTGLNSVITSLGDIKLELSMGFLPGGWACMNAINTSQVYAEFDYSAVTENPPSGSDPDCTQYILKACLETGSGANSNVEGEKAYKIENSTTGAVIPQDGPAC